jgi:hypothetical protein
MTCFVAGITMSFLMYFASYTENFNNFAVIFGFGNGLVLGVIYILPIGHCYQFFPRRKGIISFIVIAASGIGTLLFAYFALQCMNPNNLSLQEAGQNLYYGRDIAMKFAEYLRILSGLTLGFVSGGGLLLFQYPAKYEASLKKEMRSKEKEKEERKMGSLMNLEFMLEMEEPKEIQKNPFGNVEYDVLDLGRTFDKKQDKAYGDNGDNMFWAPLDESFTSYRPPNEEENDKDQEPQDAAKV